MDRRPTIKDVAREAGVSHATVSYILNNNRHSERISQETKDRVWDAVQRLGYKSNPLGRALKRGYTTRMTLLIVTWNLAKSHSATAMAISRTAAAYDLEVTVHVADSDYDADAFLKRSTLYNTGGLLVLWDSPALQESHVQELAAQGLPVVDLLPDGPSGVSVVTADREDAGYKVTKHLIDLGHKRIGVICDTNSRAKTTLRKLAGYNKAIAEAGICFDEALIENVSEFGFEGGYRGFNRMIERSVEPTGIFCASDWMALGALAAAGEIGRKCPSELSLVGYGDAQEGEYWRPPLTTVSLSANQVAAEAINLVLSRRADPELGSETVLIPGELLVRSSTAPPAK